MRNLLNKIEIDYTYHEKVRGHNTYTYIVELTHNGITETFSWKYGLALQVEPELDDVLEGLIIDMRYDDELIHYLFDDEEKAKKIINHLKEQNRKVNRLFTKQEQRYLTDYFE